MEQLRLDVGARSEGLAPVRLETRGREDVVALMADAILAVVQSNQEDDDERVATQR